MQGQSKNWTAVNALFPPAAIVKLDALAQRIGGTRSQILRLLVREARVREPDITVELATGQAPAEVSPDAA
jgi:hypothetical protein